MGIKEISAHFFPLGSMPGKKLREPDRPTAPQGDLLEVSPEALAQYEAMQAERIQAIRERIETGFYFQREVVERVAQALMKDLTEVQ